ncbi:unnamed protein product [Aphanomyces euteiches]
MSAADPSALPSFEKAKWNSNGFKIHIRINFVIMKLSLHLWESAASTRFSCLYHAFVLGIGRGTLPLDAFQTFLLQDAFFLHGFLQAFAHAVTKAATTTDTITLVTLMQGVNDELKLHTSYMEVLHTSWMDSSSSLSSLVLGNRSIDRRIH